MICYVNILQCTWFCAHCGLVCHVSLSSLSGGVKKVRALLSLPYSPSSTFISRDWLVFMKRIPSPSSFEYGCLLRAVILHHHQEYNCQDELWFLISIFWIRLPMEGRDSSSSFGVQLPWWVVIPHHYNYSRSTWMYLWIYHYHCWDWSYEPAITRLQLAMSWHHQVVLNGHSTHQTPDVFGHKKL